MGTVLLLCTLVAGQTPPAAPGILSNKTEEEYDKVVDRFILYDIGRLGVLEGQQALRDFNRLDASAIPALVRGLNKAARLDASCPVVLISNRLRGLLSFTEDPATLDTALRSIGQGVTPQSPHYDAVRSLHSEVAQRRLAIEQGKIAALRARDLLVRQLYVQNAKTLKTALKHPQSEMRWAAARVVGAKGEPLGEELISLLSDREPEVRLAAHQALIRLGRGLDLGPDADAEAAAQGEAIKQWRAWWEAAQLAFALPKAKSEQQIDLIAKLKDTKGVYYTQALADVIPHLPGEIRVKAQDALVERMSRMTAATLREKLKDSSREVRRAAALACAEKEDKSFVADLIGLVAEKDSFVAKAALDSLKTLTGQDFGASADRWRDWWAKQGDR